MSTPDEHPVNPIIVEMHDQNDRGCAIVASTILDAQLAEAIEQQWPPISRDMRSRLFVGTAPLASFAAKILVAQAMGVLSAGARQDFDRIRRIRNYAAHAGTPFSFDLPKIQEQVDRLSGIAAMGPDEKPGVSEGRNRFTGSVKFLLMYLHFQQEAKRRWGHHTVLPVFNTEESRRSMNSSSDSKRGS